MYGLAAIGYGVSCILGPILSHYVLFKPSDFLILYLTGCFCTLISCAILYNFNDDKFSYSINQNVNSDSTEMNNKETMINN